MKKKFLIILAILVVVILAIVAIYLSNKHSLESIKSIIKQDVKNANNVSVKAEFFDENNNLNGSMESYKKDNYIYIIQNNSSTEKAENLINTEEKTSIMILENAKAIVKSSTDNTEITINALDEFNRLVDENAKYKYLGKSENNIKISLSKDDETEYFYINSESGNIEKTEFYKDDAIKSIAKYVYSYNTVTDDDILTFDINNYPDYTYNEI